MDGWDLNRPFLQPVERVQLVALNQPAGWYIHP